MKLNWKALARMQKYMFPNSSNYINNTLTLYQTAEFSLQELSREEKVDQNNLNLLRKEIDSLSTKVEELYMKQSRIRTESELADIYKIYTHLTCISSMEEKKDDCLIPDSNNSNTKFNNIIQFIRILSASLDHHDSKDICTYIRDKKEIKFKYFFNQLRKYFDKHSIAEL